MQGSSGATADIDIAIYTFSEAAVKFMEHTSDDDSAVIEHLQFEYGGMEIDWSVQNAAGQITATNRAGWNAVKNVACTGTAYIPTAA